jgi:hypothetical protein
MIQNVSTDAMPTGRPRRGSARGVWLVVGVLALGAVVLWGFFQARRIMSPATMKPATTRAL